MWKEIQFKRKSIDKYSKTNAFYDEDNPSTYFDSVGDSLGAQVFLVRKDSHIELHIVYQDDMSSMQASDGGLETLSSTHFTLILEANDTYAPDDVGEEYLNHYHKQVEYDSIPFVKPAMTYDKDMRFEFKNASVFVAIPSRPRTTPKVSIYEDEGFVSPRTRLMSTRAISRPSRSSYSPLDSPRIEVIHLSSRPPTGRPRTARIRFELRPSSAEVERMEKKKLQEALLREDSVTAIQVCFWLIHS
jgi:hypothetical protein